MRQASAVSPFCRPPRPWRVSMLGFLLGLIMSAGCKAGQPETSQIATGDAKTAPAKPEKSDMWMIVGKHRFIISLADNAAARAFASQLPLTLDMSELNNNEKYASLPKALPTRASRPGTIRNGDLMLYGTDTLVVFYATFNSSYSYTRLGRVDDPADLAKALGKEGVRITFSVD